jgi:hypothetical protein
VSKRTLAVIGKLIKIDKWLDTARQPTIEFNIVGTSLTTRRADYERDTLE